MSFVATIVPIATTINAKVTNNSGVLNPVSVTLRNQIQEIRSIEDIADVAEINVTNGATLVYNSTTDKYDVKILDLDGGSF